MVRKPSNPALYELIKARSALHHGADGPFDAPKPASPRVRDRWLSPGHPVRFPVGYLFIAGAVVAGIMVGTYIFGYRRGDEAAQAGYDESLLALARRSEEAPTRDPLIVPGRLVAPQEWVTEPPPAVAPPPAPAPGTDAQIFHDPRQPGLTYFVLVLSLIHI